MPQRQENPYIDSARVSRVLPNKIKITVEERIEKYLLEFAELTPKEMGIERESAYQPPTDEELDAIMEE